MSTISSSTTTTTAYTVSADTTGTLVIQTGATPTTAVTVNASGAVGVGSSPSYGTSGQVLTSAGSSAVPTWTTVSASQWTTTGSDIYYGTSSSNNVGIGTNGAPARKLEVNGGSNITARFSAVNPVVEWICSGGSNINWIIAAQYNVGNALEITPSTTNGGNTYSTPALQVNSSGNLTISGSTAQKASGTTWSNPSDQRLKDNITDYNKGLTELLQVRVRTWEYNGKGGTTQGTKGLGVIADEISQILPETVDTYEAKLNLDDDLTTNIKRFNATEITWLLVNSVKELKALIDAQAAEIAELRGTR
jgi:hypothetical protein